MNLGNCIFFIILEEWIDIRGINGDGENILWM